MPTKMYLFCFDEAGFISPITSKAHPLNGQGFTMACNSLAGTCWMPRAFGIFGILWKTQYSISTLRANTHLFASATISSCVQLGVHHMLHYAHSTLLHMPHFLLGTYVIP